CFLSVHNSIPIQKRETVYADNGAAPTAGKPDRAPEVGLMRTMKTAFVSPASSSSSTLMARSKKPGREKGYDQAPPRITSNVKQNLQFLRLWREYQKQKSGTPKPATSYRKKKIAKEPLSEDTDLYEDPTMNLYHTHQGLDTAVPVLLVDGYNVCGYWPKLKKHFMKGRLDVARQKLIDELITFSVVALKDDGCPRVWVVTSDSCQQQAAYGASMIQYVDACL
ncbi:hypothetical protein Taro_024586, partial [Colocasia esculenta]|nr:hypothetical protein [Colocasia esculenta]